MPKRMPPLEQRFASAVDRALELPEAGERIRASSPPGSAPRQELRPSRLEALYETAYLRIFLLWEDFLEQTFLRFMCGYHARTGPAILIRPAFSSLGDAERAILLGKDYVSWANPTRVSRRCRRHIAAGTHETVINSNFSRLEAFNAVRNRIAHSSRFARLEFDRATMSLHGRRYPASSPGRFLRDTAVTSPAPQSWLHFVADELVRLAAQICPS
jgi:hypothetical protein